MDSRSQFDSSRADRQSVATGLTIRTAHCFAAADARAVDPPGDAVASSGLGRACFVFESFDHPRPLRRAHEIASRLLLACLIGCLHRRCLGFGPDWCRLDGSGAALGAVFCLGGCGPGPALGWTSLCAVIAIAIAFHWSPEVLAYTMESSYRLGVLVFVPLVLWDALRSMLPIWLAGRLAATTQGSWLPAAIAAVVVETVLPSVFPWRWGYMQVAWPWTLQAVDLFGPEWSTFMFFAHTGAMLAIGGALIEWLPRRLGVAGERSGDLRLSIGRVARSAAVWISLANAMYSAGAANYWQRQIDRAATLTVALVQVDPSYQQSPADMRRLSDPIAAEVDLVCWPESSGGTYSNALQSLDDPQQVFRNSREPNRGLRPWEHPPGELLRGAKIYHGEREQPNEL